MNNSINQIVYEILKPHLSDSAMETALEAIVKLISDGFVRKELYKEKLAIVNKLTNELETVKEACSTAEQSNLELLAEIENDTLAKEKAYKKENALKSLEDCGANPQYYDLLLKELSCGNEEIDKDCDIYDYYTAKIMELKSKYPYIFGELSVKNADIASSPVKVSSVNNPWKRETVDLEEQIRLFRENPSLARQMAISVGIRL